MLSSTRFVNRDLSWLRFNSRVLHEAVGTRNPLLERARFLSIVSSNLDEFFMVRVGKLERKMETGIPLDDPSGMTPKTLLKAVRRGARRQVESQYAVYHEQLVPEMERAGIHILRPEELSPEQRQWLSGYFYGRVMPVLTPRSLSPSQPFPLLQARRIYIAALLESPRGGPAGLSLVRVPASLKRFVPLPVGAGKARGVLVEELIGMHLSSLFPSARRIQWMPLRITRNTDFLFNMEDAEALIDEMTEVLKQRTFGKIVRVEIPATPNDRILRRLRRALDVPQDVFVRVPGPIDLTFLMREVSGISGFEHLRFPPFKPAMSDRLRQPGSIFRAIREGDLFFHHPYDSFDPVLRFVREAAEDPHVLAIKQTLYRVSSKSALIPTLARAAYLGKQVTVLVEVRARFDEENNINWCRALEAAGCQVLYGVPMWKAHSKITLVVRQEAEGLKRYVHLGTGNYNDSTARLYTDFGILTADSQIGEDAGAFFNILTGYSHTFPMKDLVASPYAMRDAITMRIKREADNAKRGLPAGIIAKMNSLSDPGLIEALYAAAKAGVKVRLIVRGVCCMRLKDVPNIAVHSIVGRFLEHARAFVFTNAGRREVFISSADFMPRNIDRRVELTTPVKDPAIAAKISDILERQWADTYQSWELKDNDSYERVPWNGQDIGIQQALIQEASQQ